MTTLTCYRLTASRFTKDFVDFLHEDHRSLPSELLAGAGFQARLYNVAADQKQPLWAPFVESIFPSASIDDGGAPSALIVVRLTRPLSTIKGCRGSWFAFAFGQRGRFLLDSSRIVPGYGLRIALNIMYPKGSPTSAHLRSLESKRHGMTVFRSRTQAATPVDVDDLEVRRSRDLLTRATGSSNDNAWGSSISGSDAFTFAEARASGQSLAQLCRSLDAEYAKTDYLDGFSWIDHVRAVSDDVLVKKLETKILEAVRAAAPGVSVAPPGILDWEEVQHFRHTGGGPSSREAVADAPQMAALRSVTGLRAPGLTVASLKRARITAVGANADIAIWPAWKCIVGEVSLNRRTYLFDEGQFFEVDRDYLTELNEFISRMDARSHASTASSLPLLSAKAGETEGEYNRRVHDNLSRTVLLDKHDTGIPGGRSTVEICDLLTTDRQLVHVKRHLGSATLSHLFAQGLTSAELLQSSPAYRKSAMKRIREQSDPAEARFNFFEDRIDTREFEIVYAVIEEWQGRLLVDALPFFSKVNLRETTSNLEQRGFAVSVRRIDVTAAPASRTPAT